jgi:hypothetical protein
MNNGLWDDRLNHLKQQDLQREIQELHLLKEAGLNNPNLLGRLGKILQGGLLVLGRRLQDRKAVDQAMYKPARKTSV